MQCPHCAAAVMSARRVIHDDWEHGLDSGLWVWSSSGKKLVEIHYRCIEGHEFQLTDKYGKPAVIPVLPPEVFTP